MCFIKLTYLVTISRVRVTVMDCVRVIGTLNVWPKIPTSI